MDDFELFENHFWYVICIECSDSNGLIFDDKNKSQRVLDIFNSCLSCRCCNRHQTNKPNMWQPFNNNNNNLSIHQNSFCICSCRHLARMICRKHPNSTT